MEKHKGLDAIVVGGGPAGSCLAGTLASLGLKVLVLEGKKFPRDHIGESLLAMSMPYLKELGIIPKLEAEGFPKKTGAVFVWGKSKKKLDLFMNSSSPGYAYQVIRSRFDEMLLEHARELGANVIFDCWAREPILNENGRIIGLRIQMNDGNNQEIYAKYVIDASGLAQFLPKKLKLPIHIDGHKRIALTSYFEGAQRLESPHENNIISEVSKDGWLWYIPLNDKLTSVGFVGDAIDITTDPNEMLRSQICSTSLVKEKLGNSTLIRDVKLLKYTNHIVDAPLWKDGYVLIGDTAIFVDPLFSTGVHGAIYSASLAASALASVISGEITEQEAAEWYQDHVQRHYLRVNHTVKMLYRIHPGKSRFWSTRNSFDIGEEDAEQIVSSLGVSGLTFFINTYRDGVLELPPAIVKLIDEFVLPSNEIQEIKEEEILVLNSEMEKVYRPIIYKKKLVPGLTIQHKRNRTLSVEMSLQSSHYKIISSIDGTKSAKEIYELIEEDMSEMERNKFYVYLGSLKQLGVLHEYKNTFSCV
ncbi:NAD(P)/FAD-dependent oxidoreductase [Paenibacillus enshidis]|uniref:NAD(P)/FAD-dependent oxidoreductase n=1 Tax=Paenibacillus enshidis TaxID=1458439 RepID=A0ABV5AZ85_9BACL